MTRRANVRPIPLPMDDLRALADAIAADLVRHHRRYEQPGEYYTSFTISYEEVGTGGASGTVPIVIVVRSQPRHWMDPRAYAAGGSVVSRRFVLSKSKKRTKIALQLGLHAGWYSEVVQPAWIADELFDVLIHEATHLRDRLGYATATSADVGAPRFGSPEYVAYLNDPDEIRARTQQIVHRAEINARAYSRDSGGWCDTRSLFDRALGFFGAENPVREAIWRYLTPRNRQRILRAVYQRVMSLDICDAASDEESWDRLEAERDQREEES